MRELLMQESADPARYELAVVDGALSLTYGALRVLARAMELAGTTTDAKAIHARADEAAATLPDEFKPSELLGVSPQGHLRQTTVAAHIVGGKFLPIKLPNID